MKQTFLLFLTKYVYICLTHFCDKLKIALKKARGKSWFFQCRKFIQTYLEINIRSAEVNTTKMFIASLKFFEQLFLISQYVYDFYIFSFKKLFLFFKERYSFFWFLHNFYLLVQLWIIFFTHNFFHLCY